MLSKLLISFSRFAIAASLAISFAAPHAVADHAYTHRYVIVGRIVDPQGVPLVGANASLTVWGFSTIGRCEDREDTRTDALGLIQTRQLTDADGVFVLCYHIHSLPAEAPEKGWIFVNGVAKYNLTLDPFFRWQYVGITMEPPSGVDRSTAPVRDLVVGRVWDRSTGEVSVENLPAYGIVLPNVPVEIQLTTDNKSTTVSTTTSAYGDFAIWAPGNATRTMLVNVTAKEMMMTALMGSPDHVASFEVEGHYAPDVFVAEAITGFAVFAAGAIVIGGSVYILRSRRSP